MQIAQQYYAVNIRYLGKLQLEIVAMFQKISQLQHQFLKHKASLRLGIKRKGRQWQTLAAKKARITKVKLANLKAKIVVRLCKLLSLNATWQTEKQAKCMQMIIALKHNYLAINMLLIKARKSILFILLVVMQDIRTSIVIVLYIALIDNLVMQVIEISANCIWFQTLLSVGQDSIAQAAQLVVVSANIVACVEFLAYANRLLGIGLLQQIFVDKCYMVIIDVSYQAKLKELYSLHQYRCLLMLLTTMLLVMLKDQFWQKMLAQLVVIV